MGSSARLRLAGRGLLGYLREASGETAYERYVDHRRRLHPDEPVMSRRDFRTLAHGPARRQPRRPLLLIGPSAVPRAVASSAWKPL
jgi:uncharacterized short protein YbdD (DUF466 family)